MRRDVRRQVDLDLRRPALDVEERRVRHRESVARDIRMTDEVLVEQPEARFRYLPPLLLDRRCAKPRCLVERIRWFEFLGLEDATKALPVDRTDVMRQQML